MAAYIVAIGVVVLHAFATAVLWFEFRSREQRSIERIERATNLILEAIGLLRSDLVRAGPGSGPPPPSGSPSGGAGPLPRSALLPAPSRGPSSSARSKAELRARIEAQEDARDAARGNGPPEDEVAEDARRSVEIPRPVFAPPTPGTEPAVCGAGFRGGRPGAPLPDASGQRDSGEQETPDDLTRVYSAAPDEADAQIPGVEVRLRSRARHASLPPLDTTLVSGSPAPIPLEEVARLTRDEIDRIDALAAQRGLTRGAMIVELAELGIEAMMRSAGPATPPDGPANDAPPPSGERRT